VTLLEIAARVLRLIEEEGHRGCLAGGLAVSARCDPRFTRDVDLVVAVADDAEAESLSRALVSVGFAALALVEQEAVDRLAMVRVVDADGVSIDLLVASSGIENEIVHDAELIGVLPGLTMPVARVGHLMAMKLLSVSPGRETDSADLRELARVADEDEWSRAHESVALIESRGFARGRDLRADLTSLRSTFGSTEG
jgi:hypothetical protein